MSCAYIFIKCSLYYEPFTPCVVMLADILMNLRLCMNCVTAR